MIIGVVARVEHACYESRILVSCISQARFRDTGGNLSEFREFILRCFGIRNRLICILDSPVIVLPDDFLIVIALVFAG